MSHESLCSLCRLLSPHLRRLDDPTPKELVQRWSKQIEHALSEGRALEAISADLVRKHLLSTQKALEARLLRAKPHV